ncbi:hypothetical protein INT43_006396 [Umbelopsis isabellina]|uniref:PX domain-containing protein n=1 Tax=Mortierella isabellina TaxID=91625 RepID=A0A8H7Q140_MORIS|nr:hypothetical protein INT43_006396 [Umbelopsis isabellina]
MTLASPQPRPSLSSTLLGKKVHPTRSGIKLAPSIATAQIVSTVKRHDQKLWYSILVTPRNDLPHRSITRAPYTIFRRYEDFLAFSNRLQEIVGAGGSESHSVPKSPRMNKYKSITTAFMKDIVQPVVPIPKLKSRIVLFVTKKDAYQQRYDLDKFLDTVFRLPNHVLKSLAVLEFFGIDKSDMEHKVHQDMRYLSPDRARTNLTVPSKSYTSKRLASAPSTREPPPPMLSRSCSALPIKVSPETFKKAISNPNLNHNAATYGSQHSNGKLKTSKLYNKAKDAQPRHGLLVPELLTPCTSHGSWDETSTSENISFATKDEMFHPTAVPIEYYSEDMIYPLQVAKAPSPNPKLSRSTPAPRKHYVVGNHMPFPRQKEDKRLSPDSAVELLDSVPLPLNRSLSIGHDSNYLKGRNIRIKVIYDLDNIFILQVPRIMPLCDLRVKIASKLSNMEEIKDSKTPISLLYYGAQRTSHEDSHNLRPSDAYKISSGNELAYAMMCMWSDLEKVTVRLMIGM